MRRNDDEVKKGSERMEVCVVEQEVKKRGVRHGV